MLRFKQCQNIKVEESSVEEIIFKPDDYKWKTSITREYGILNIKYSDFTQEEQNEIIKEANNLLKNANPNSANSNEYRSEIVRENDAFSGILAEFAVVKLLNSIVPNSAYRPEVTSLKNQIDIYWLYNNIKYSIEVRSSFVKNGIEFALYAVNRETNKTYFDILGPYYQKYKVKYDVTKDIYARVLFNGQKSSVKERFIKNNESFYVIGFISGSKLVGLNYKKLLKENSSIVSKYGKINGNYFVAPINEIMDVRKFKKNVNDRLAD